MFSLFKKSPPSIPYSDKVWKRAEYARRGMLMMAMMRLQHGKPCLLVNFFESETDKLQQFMQEHKLDFIRLDESIASGPASASLYLVNAHNLSKSVVIDFLKQNASTFAGEALFSGHYPMSVTEYATLKSLSDSGYDKFIFCLSFEDPLLEMFGSQNILPLLEKLGLEEEESIEHAMVTQSIQRAREKVESKVSHEIKAKSPEEWFALNLKK
jgi:hypothetical protein